MLISGALAGLAGGVEMAGVLHRLQPRFSPGYGYTAILVAWLARLHPLAIPPVALFLGMLLTGGEQLQVSAGVPSSLVDILQGLILFLALAAEAFLRRRHGEARPPELSGSPAVEGSGD
jgi:simple sugar transport system permease protein